MLKQFSCTNSCEFKPFACHLTGDSPEALIESMWHLHIETTTPLTALILRSVVF